MGKTQSQLKFWRTKQMCICKTFTTYIAKETGVSFCHTLLGKSKIITAKLGCNCPTCPVYKKMKLKSGYYCILKSEIEQEMVKKA